MKTYQDNFNLVAGVTCTVREFLTVGKHTLLRKQIRKNGKLSRTSWEHRIDTSDTPYPSLACIMGAASFSFAGPTAWPVICGFTRSVLRTKIF